MRASTSDQKGDIPTRQDMTLHAIVHLEGADPGRG